MSVKIIDGQLQELRQDMEGLYLLLSNLTLKIGNKQYADQIGEIAAKLGDPFLFVIAGEVKAGKSSFVNALLQTGTEVCKVAPDPCTDVIQQILYREEAGEEIVNPYLKKIYLNAKILESISIVDTPGTNTIIDHHQEITERFVPQSDMVVFVFEAKNPYRQSAWALFDFIKEDWRKKVFFVLQQKDLMTPEDLVINTEGVRKIAREKGIEEPLVFAVSALQEQQGDPASGFAPLRKYIREHITGGQPLLLKMESHKETASSVVKKLEEAIALRKKQYESDLKFRTEVEIAVNEQELRSNKRVDLMVDSLLLDYDRITGGIRREFTSGLGFFTLAGRSIKSLFTSDEKNIKEWLAELTRKLEKDLRSSFQEKLESGMVDISDSIKQMVKIVELQMKASNTILPTDHEIFGDIAERRQEAIKTIQSNYSDFVENTENFMSQEMNPKASSFVPNLATGGGLAVVGAVLAATAKGSVFDITGGIISALGIGIAGVTLIFSKRKAVNAFDVEIKTGREKLQLVLDEQIKQYTRKIKERLNRNFDPLDVHLSGEERALTELVASTQAIDHSWTMIDSKISSMKAKTA
ncbi:dynamin family protein [Chitinophagales bacterium]|nr:dynamin family protein [Chitinophagales bacterium]